MHEGGEREDGEYPLPSSGTAQQLGCGYHLRAAVHVLRCDRCGVGGRHRRPRLRRCRRRRGLSSSGERQATRRSAREEQQREELRGRMGWLIKQVGLTPEDALRVRLRHAGREVKSSRDLTVEELQDINNGLEVLLPDRRTRAWTL